MNATVKQAISTLLVDENPDARRLAAEDVANSEEIASIAALAAALNDPSKGVRDAAFRGLLGIGGLKVARAVVESIGDSSIVTRNLVADLLCKIGAPAVPAIIPYIHDINQDVRKFAVDIVGLIGATEAVPHLVLLLDDPDENVLLSAIEALGNIGDRGALEPLFAVYNKYPLVCPAVAEALGKIGDLESGGFLVDALSRQINGESSNALLEYTIIESLGSVGNENSLPVLIEYLSHPKGKLTHVVIHSIVQIHERLGMQVRFSEDHYPKLLEVLSDEDEDVCISAIKGLKCFSGEEITRAFLNILGRSEKIDAYLYPVLPERDNVFAAVLDILKSRKNNKRSLLLLIAKLVQITIHKVFTYSEDKLEFELLYDAFDKVALEWDQADEPTRAVIVDILFCIDGDRAVHFLDKILNDPDPWLRIHVMEILVSISDARSPDLIQRFLEDDDEMVREVAVSALSSKRSDNQNL